MTGALVGPNASLQERFDAGATVRPPDGCWPWQRGTNGIGYGTVSCGAQQKMLAHRASYELHIGPIPDGQELHHTCRNRGCVNPDHLIPVTRREHVRDFDAHTPRQTHCIHGHEMTIYAGTRQCKTCAQIASRNSKRRTKLGWTEEEIAAGRRLREDAA